LYSSPNVIRQIKSRRMKWAGHVARMGEESVQGFDGKPRRKESTQKTKAWIGGWNQNGFTGGVWSGFMWLRIGTSGGLL
jgi:hypothetical protein